MENNLKMENNKYYTPQIDEFHVGFEYEFNDGDILYEEWQKASIKDGTQIDDITRKENGNDVYALRVKHLDREDIESEEWIVKVWHNDSGYLNKWVGAKKYTLGFHNSDYITISVLDFGNNIMLFQGKIKNKSELKRIMQQIGINQ